MKSTLYIKNGQAALEYLLVIGVGLLVLTLFLAYTFNFSVGYTSAKTGQSLALAINSIQGAVNYLSSQQVGTTFNFALSIPNLQLVNSYFCNGLVTLSSQGEQAAQALKLSVVGEIPLVSGQYNAQGVLASVNGQNVVDMKFALPISFINSSYSLSNSLVSYNLSFQSISGALVQNVNYTISAYTPSNTLLASKTLFSASGSASGSLNITQPYPIVKIIVNVPSLSISSASCLKSATQLLVTLTNTQSSATSSPFQQMVIVNSSKYSSYEAGNLSNLQFSYTNGTIIPSWLEGGNLASFDGVNSLVNATTQIISPSQKQFTISVWAYLSAPAFAQGDLQSEAFPGQGVYELAIFHDAVFFGGDGCGNVNSSFTQNISAKTLYNIIAIFNSSGNSVIYINGIKRGSKSMSLCSSNAKSIIGNGWNAPFNGTLANVQIYNTALSNSQVQTLYSEGEGGLPVIPNSLMAWWPLTGNANDFSGNGYNGVSTNVSFSGSGSGSSNTVYWLKLGSIPANSQLQVDLNFYPKTTNVLNSKNTGEAPEISPTYAQYDNGASIFNIYWNFNGTSLPTGWYVPVTDARPSVHNGLFIASGGESGTEYNLSSFSNIIVDTFGEQIGGQTAGWSHFGLLNITATSEILWSELRLTPSILNPNNVTSGYVYHFLTPNELTNTYGVYGTSYISNTANWYYNDFKVQSSYFSVSLKTIFFFNGGTSSGGNAINVFWIRTRTYPPNGVMPSQSFVSFR